MAAADDLAPDMPGRNAAPAGVFGMGIVEAENEAGARAITEQDPVVVEGIGRYAIFPTRLLKKE